MYLIEKSPFPFDFGNLKVEAKSGVTLKQITEVLVIFKDSSCQIKKNQEKVLGVENIFDSSF
jgi:hypothetical protein